jgi:hypothetical protein
MMANRAAGHDAAPLRQAHSKDADEAADGGRDDGEDEPGGKSVGHLKIRIRARLYH